MRSDMEQERKKEEIESVDTTLERAEDEAVTGSLSAVVASFVFGFEGRDTWHGEEEVEGGGESGEIVRGVVDSDSGDCGPGKDRGGGDGEGSEEESL